MPLGTLDRTPPPFFRQGPSALSKLTVCSALALFLMVADARFGVTQPVRALLATVLYPAQWLVLQPLIVLRGGVAYLQSHKSTQIMLEQMRINLVSQSRKANQVEQLALENTRLRALLELRQRISTPAPGLSSARHRAARPSRAGGRSGGRRPCRANR